MATFSDSTSSNGVSNVWVAKVDYSTTAYEGYTLVKASLLLTAKYRWSCTLNNGYSLSINGDKVSGSTAQINQTDSSGSGVTHTLLTHSVKVYHTSNKKITISASINANNIYYNSGGCYMGTYSLSNDVTLAPLKTSCTAPTTFTASSNNFETNVTLSWSGAAGGTGNAIASYYVQYATSSNNSTWGDWKALATITSTSTSGKYTKDMSSLVSRGYYVKFRIRTQPSDSSYNSGYKTSDTIRRQPYTKCAAPTIFTVQSNNFDTKITLSWSDASGGTSNSISSYAIQYATSSNNSTWGDWTAFQTVTTTKTAHSFSIDVSSYVARGYYVKFRIRTQGTAGSSYYSDWKSSSAVRRNPKSPCSPPSSITLKADSQLNNFTTTTSSYVFDDYIKISWSNGVAGNSVNITGYILEYQTAYLDVKDTMVWGNWINLITLDANTVSYKTSNFSINRGDFIRFRIATQASDVAYNSTYTVSSIMKRNTLPNNLPSKYITYNKEFSNGDEISLQWTRATDDDNNSPYITKIEGYEIFGQIADGDWQQIASIRDIPTTTHITINITGDSDSVSVSHGAFCSVNNITSQELLATFYNSIENEQYLNLKIVPVDMFCNIVNIETLKADAYIITIQRYDRSGVAFGINDNWIDCQIYYGVVSTGMMQILNSSTDWTAGGVSSTTGNNTPSGSGVRSDFIETQGVTIQKSSDSVYESEVILCHLYYYDADYNYITNSYGNELSSNVISVDEDYKYVRIMIIPANTSSGSATSQSDLYKTIEVSQRVNVVEEWVETDIHAGINGSWIQCNE